MDVQSAFLHGVLDEEVYMNVRQGHKVNTNNFDPICKLHKSIYGLKQASRTWFAKLRDVISLLGFTRCKSDYSIFVCHKIDSITIIIAYVDDLLITRDNLCQIKQTKEKLKHHFAIEDLSAHKYFLV